MLKYGKHNEKVDIKDQLILNKWLLRQQSGINFLVPTQTSMFHVTTLALGPQPKQRCAKLWAKREARESHLMLPKVQKNVREWTLTLPSELSFWELDSPWIPKSSEGDCNGQNPLD